MSIIATYADSWLSMYTSLFPMVNVNKTAGEMLSQYDKLQDPNADPIATAALLLSVALTVQQAPEDIKSRAKGMKDPYAFIRDVAETVDRVVVNDDNLACSLEGIQTIMLFLRL